jgi:transcriptional regulator with XRE-family HTH domain
MSLQTGSLKLIEAGRMLQQERERKGWSIEEVSKKMGLRPDQIQAIEEGNNEHFKKAAQPLIWFARLYAKKLNVNLPEFMFNDIKRKPDVNSATQLIPAFLMKDAIPFKKC